MKKTKKLLALIMAVAMMAGLFVLGGPSAGAAVVTADYSDADAIVNNEAVDVLTTLRVIEGTYGAYRPGDNVTRAEAAAILARLVASRSAADSLPAADTGFTDVPASHWASKYVAYCVTNGYVAGYSPTRFGPDDNVTAAQFSAMLLRAVGYGKLGEFTGPLWETNAIVLGMRERILEGDRNFSAHASRDDTAQYAFKALTDVHMVDLSTDRTNYVPRVRRAPHPYIVGDFIDAPVAIMDNIYPQLEAQRPTPAYSYSASGGVVNIPAVPMPDLYGRPSTKWIYAGVEIGLYPFKPIAAFSANLGPTNDIRRTAVLNAIGTGYAFSASGIEVYFNGDSRVGNDVSDGATPPSYSTYPEVTVKETKGTVTSVYGRYKDIYETSRATIAEKIGVMPDNGLLVEVFISYPNTSYARIDVVTVTQTDLYEVISVSASARQVNLKAVSPIPVDTIMGSTVLIRDIDYPELYDVIKDCKVEDYVLLTMGWDNKWIPGDIYIPDTVTGAIRSNSMTGGSPNRVTAVTLISATTPYRLAWRNGAMEDLGFGSVPLGDQGVAYPPANGTDESILFLDKYGYVAGLKSAAPPGTAFVYVIETNQYIVGSDGIARPGFRGVLANGEEVVVRGTVPGNVATLYTYTISGGVYVLDDPIVPSGATAAGAPAEAKSAVDLEDGVIAARDLRLTAASQNADNDPPPHDPHYNNQYASNVKFIYLKDVGTAKASFSVRDGVQKVGDSTAGQFINEFSYAVVETRAGVDVVTAVFLYDETPGTTDPNAIIYISGAADVENIYAGTETYQGYRAWFAGETTARIMYITENTVPVGFYTWAVKETIGETTIYNVFKHATDTGNTAVTVVASPTTMQVAGILRSDQATVATVPTVDPAWLAPLAHPALLTITSAAVVDVRTEPQTANYARVWGGWEEIQALVREQKWPMTLSIMYNADTSVASRIYIQTLA